MRRLVTKNDLKTFIKRLDTKCLKFTDDKFNDIIDKAFAEMQYVFSDEDALEVSQYIEDGVEKMSYDIDRDVTYIYDAFLSSDAIGTIQNTDLMVEIDPRIIGRINIDFGSQADRYGRYSVHPPVTGGEPTVLIVRYYYVPTSSFDEIYMDREAQKLLLDALKYVVYADLHDKKELLYGNKFRDALASMNKDPLDMNAYTSPRRFAI